MPGSNRPSARSHNVGSPGVFRHYLPVLIAACIFIAVVVLTPSVLAPSAALRARASPGRATDLPGGFVRPRYPRGDAPQDPGLAASGVHCGPGVRQVTWSKYAPYCQPEFHGYNGGATSPGVTSKTITITFRYAATPAEVSALNQVAPGTAATEQQAIKLMNQYISVFNKNYDLYGRHVVLKVFNGQGDYLQELSGSGQAAAEADAATAKSLGAFADVSGTVFNTPPYDDALATQHIISVGGLFDSASALRQEAPYEYFPGPDCEKTAQASAALVGRSMAGLPAIYAGSKTMRHETRTFGLVSPDNPIYKACGQALVNDLKRNYGITLKTWIRYTVDLNAISEAASNALNMVTQLKSAGVTTVLCGCDPITPLFLTQDANDQNYHPEWLSLGLDDAFSRLPNAAQWDHSLSGGVGSLKASQEEAVAAFHLADPNPASTPPPSFQFIYEPLLLLFDALQAAGPDLNATTFEQGLDSLPPSLPNGEFGPWRFGPGTVDPLAGFQVLRWDSQALSPEDGLRGTELVCNNATTYYFSDHVSALPLHRQLDCPAVP